MSAMLKKHRAIEANEDAEIDDDLIEEIEDADNVGNESIDPRWSELKKLKDNN